MSTHGQGTRARLCRMGRSSLTLVVSSGVAIVLGMTLAASAGAYMGYGTPTVFGAVGSGGGQFDEPGGVAVNDSTGDVYVYDAGNLRVEWFNSTGSKFEGQLNGSTSPTGTFTAPGTISEHAAHGTLFNLAVDNDSSSPSFGDVYVVDPGHNVIDKFSPTGTYVSQLTGFAAPVFGVAVDSSGGVWVAEEGKEEPSGNVGPVQRYDNALANAHVETVTPEKLRSPGIAVDSSQDLFLLSGGKDVFETDHAGALLAEYTSCGCSTGLTIEPTNNELFVNEESSIVRLGTSGKGPEERIEGIASSYGVAANGSSHTLYATQRTADEVAVFGFVLLPDVTTGSATSISATSDKLEGIVNPDGQEVTTCQFEYGPTTSYGHTAPCEPAPGSGSGPVTVSATLTGLVPASTYHYRLSATNVNGAHSGSDGTFGTTTLAPVMMENPPAMFVGAQSAVLSAYFNPENLTTHYHFVYGPCPELEGCSELANTNEEEVSAQYGVFGTTQELSGLTPHTVYSFRLVANNETIEEGVSRGGLTNGPEGTFETGAAPAPTGATGTAFSVTSSGGVITATVDPDGVPTTYAFELGIYNGANTQFGIIASGSAGSNATAIAESLQLSGLQPGTTYAYRVTISSGYIDNATHSVQGAVDLLTTSGLPTLLNPPSPLAQLPLPSIPFPKIAPPAKGKKRVVRKPNHRRMRRAKIRRKAKALLRHK